MRKSDIISDYDQYVAHTYQRFPLVVERAKGARLWDTDGVEYIDLGSGIGVNALGCADEDWVRAVTKQLGKVAHLSNLYYTEPAATLAKRLCARTGMRRVFFANSGAEANEGAIKCARKYSHDKYGGGRHTIVALRDSFHGRTMATLSATGQDVFHQNFFPFLEGFRFAPANDLPAALAEVREDVCAVMLELIQGEGGVQPLERAFVEGLAEYCRARDVLLIVDEVQTGVGRTGKFLCCEHFGLRPDIVTLAKGLGGGLPIGAVLLGEKCRDTFAPGDHASTFGGNPAVCAGAIEVVDRLDSALLDAVSEKGAFFKEQLMKADNVVSVDGMGLMLGIRLKEGISSRDVVDRLLGERIVALTAKAKVRLLPPLIIPWEDCEAAAKALCRCISSYKVN